jgi:hypothetical protein
VIPLSTDDLPWFFDDGDRALAERLRAAAPALAAAEDAPDEPARDRAAVAALAEAGLFALVAPADGQVRARSLCLARELLGWVNARADSIFAVQGLGSYAVLAAGDAAQRARAARPGGRPRGRGVRADRARGRQRRRGDRDPRGRRRRRLPPDRREDVHLQPRAGLGRDGGGHRRSGGRPQGPDRVLAARSTAPASPWCRQAPIAPHPLGA